VMDDAKFRFKVCECPIDAWEVIVVQDDEYFDDRNTIYYHCSDCSEDFAIVDFHTKEILYLHPKLYVIKNEREKYEKAKR
jgi:hypothetical protein